MAWKDGWSVDSADARERREDAAAEAASHEVGGAQWCNRALKNLGRQPPSVIFNELAKLACARWHDYIAKDEFNKLMIPVEAQTNTFETTIIKLEPDSQPINAGYHVLKSVPAPMQSGFITVNSGTAVSLVSHLVFPNYRAAQKFLNESENGAKQMQVSGIASVNSADIRRAQLLTDKFSSVFIPMTWQVRDFTALNPQLPNGGQMRLF